MLRGVGNVTVTRTVCLDLKGGHVLDLLVICVCTDIVPRLLMRKLSQIFLCRVSRSLFCVQPVAADLHQCCEHGCSTDAVPLLV